MTTRDDAILLCGYLLATTTDLPEQIEAAVERTLKATDDLREEVGAQAHLLNDLYNDVGELKKIGSIIVALTDQESEGKFTFTTAEPRKKSSGDHAEVDSHSTSLSSPAITRTEPNSPLPDKKQRKPWSEERRAKQAKMMLDRIAGGWKPGPRKESPPGEADLLPESSTGGKDSTSRQ